MISLSSQFYFLSWFTCQSSCVRSISKICSSDGGQIFKDGLAISCFETSKRVKYIFRSEIARVCTSA